MKKTIVLCLSLVLMGTALAQTSRNSGVQADASIQTFWASFKTAVIKGDKMAVANLSQLPISMPFGVPAVRTRAQLIRRYREVFNHETNAAKCFGTARPETDQARPKLFEVTCKNAAGDDVIVYSFRRTRNGWRFMGLDNINE